MTQKKYLVLAYYQFTPIKDALLEVKDHQKFFLNKDASCRIYISEEGINGQLSAVEEVAWEYMEWLKGKEVFQNIVFKIHVHHENVFPRITIKHKKQLVAFDQKVDISLTGQHLNAVEWDQMLDHEPNKVVIDTRNAYEWKVGHFKGSDLPDCETFRDFPSYTQTLKKQVDPKNTKVMVCCTGGIRCEIYSAYLKQQGFENVYQLEGGIINYGLQKENKNWVGKIFVFDDRLTIPLNPNETLQKEEVVLGTCLHCQTPNDTYYNCANVECNELFLCCGSCLEVFKGCCQENCMHAPRVRPHFKENKHKPFRRMHLDRNKKEKSKEDSTISTKR